MRLRLLIYTHEFFPFLGGLGTTALNLAKGFSSRNFDVRVLAPSYPGYDKSKDADFNFSVTRMNSLSRNHGFPTPVKELTGVLYLTRELKRFAPEGIILITREAHGAAGILPSLLPEKSFARVAGYEAFRYLNGKRYSKRVVGAVMKRCYEECRAVIAPSMATKELFLDAGIDEKKIRVIYNGVNEYMLSASVNAERVNQLRRSWGVGEKDRVLLTVSRLVMGKGQDLVIRALRKISKEFDNVKYVVVGEGKYSEQLQAIAKECGVFSRVVFVGAVPYDDIIHYYDASDIFLIPNRVVPSFENVEGLPNVVYEAASRAKPIITGIRGGAKEIVSHGVNGYVISGEDVDELCEVLSELLSDDQKIRTFGARLRKVVERNYTVRKMIDDYEQLLVAS